jgi:hypothetical protein
MTADGAHRIDTAALLTNQMTVLGLIFEAFRGYSESQTKSDRVGEAWARKRDRGAPMTARCPAWLTVPRGVTSYRSPVNPQSQYEVLEDRAAVVRRIFDLTEQGFGKATIARMLNIEGVPVFAQGNGWHASYIQKIIQNPAVIGEYQPCVAPKGGVRKPVGDVIRNYFPPIISIEQFERVNDLRARRVLAQQSGHNRLVNLLSGLGRCDACGSSMTMLNKGDEVLADGSTVPRRYLRCSSSHRSQGCKARLAFSYPPIEKTLLDKVLHLAMDDQHFVSTSQVGELETRLIVAQRSLAEARRRQEIAFDAMEADGDDELARRRYRQRLAETRDCQATVTRLQGEVDAASGIVSPEEHVARVEEVRAMLDHVDEDRRYAARSRVKMALNHIIRTVYFSADAEQVVIVLGHGVRHIVLNIDGSINHDGTIWRDFAAPSDPEPVKRYFARLRGFR